MERTRNWMAVLVSLLIVGGTAPALAGLDLLYTTGEPMPVLDSGTGAETNGRSEDDGGNGRGGDGTEAGTGLGA